MKLRVDVAILGSGFGGSLLSLILTKLGKRCALIDKTAHPRFAIGESSTPLADFVLSDLARGYDLPDVLPLASFGTWQQRHPRIGCGLKRGFSYFHHSAGLPFRTDENNSNQLLVAASSNNDDSDTHWYRADVDQFLFDQAREAGVECFENTSDIQIDRETTWKVIAADVDIRCDYIIDASGAAGVLLKYLGIQDATHELQTNSRAIYGHFEGVRRFQDILLDGGIDTNQHPYTCDNAALHHVLEDAWMWNLRFSNDLVSAGVCFDANRTSAQLGSTEAWTRCVERHPSIAAQFEVACVRKEVGLRASGRLQRMRSSAAGVGWFALPHTVGFIDPLHSTGIAHTLSAVERIARLFETKSQDDQAAIRDYNETLRKELRFIDRLVSGCYQTLGRPRMFNAWCMLYFAAAHSCEMRRIDGELAFEKGFLGALIPKLRKTVDALQLPLSISLQSVDPSAVATFESAVRHAIKPFNLAGLMNDDAGNMYANTAPPRNLGQYGY